MIEIKNLTKTYKIQKGETLTAIKDINLKVEDSDIFGIIGLSGAGKSTLVRCINYLEKPTEGSVIFDGTDLGSLSKKELLKTRQQMSMIFQSFNLLQQRNVLKNVCYPLEIAGVDKNTAVEKARELLRLVGLDDREKAYPAQLSGGQKQRVAIARALATNPKVLLCDEATSALDPNTTASILSLLKQINKELGVTIIVITHEMRVIEKICNKVAVIDNSRIVEQGYVKDVFLAPKSKIARELIFPSESLYSTDICERTIRLVFDGNSTYEPIISNLALECHATVSIIAANVKNIDGKTYGQLVLQLPNDEKIAADVCKYLTEHGVVYEEVSGND